MTPAQDQQAARSTRRGRRRRLLLLGLPLLVVAVLVGAKAVSMILINDAGRAAYDTGSMTQADQEFTRLGTVNLLSPWVAWNNRGTAQYGLGAYDVAETDFRRALELVPTRQVCVVAVNLATTLEQIGDELTAAGDTAGGQQRYAEGLALLTRYACPHDTENGENAEQTRKELERKTAEQKPEDTTPTPTPSPSGTPTPTPSEDPQAEQQRQEQQEKKNADAERERNTERQRKQGGDDPAGGSNAPGDKPW